MNKDITIGTIVKSFDFPGRKDCYKVGRITAVDKGMNLYICDVLLSIWLDEKYDTEEAFQTPINGIFDDMFEGGRIQIMELGL